MLQTLNQITSNFSDATWTAQIIAASIVMIGLIACVLSIVFPLHQPTDEMQSPWGDVTEAPGQWDDVT